MSPGMDASWPWLDQLWGGRQSARSVHFLAMAGIAGFLVLHLVLVVLSGPFRQIGAMITELSDEQAGYIGVPVEGPYKPDTYRY